MHLASKRERRQYSKRTEKSIKTSLKTAAALGLAGDATRKYKNSLPNKMAEVATNSDKYGNKLADAQQIEQNRDESSHLMSSYSSPDLNLDNSLPHSPARNEVDMDKENSNQTKSSEPECSLLKSLNQSEHENSMRIERYLEESGLHKSFIQFLRTPPRGSPNSQTSSTFALKEAIVNLVDCEYKSLIEWARFVPEFSKLSIGDQTCLIELNFLEVIVVDYIWKSVEEMSNAGEKLFLVFNQSLMLSRAMCKEIGLDGIYDYLVPIVTKLRRLDMSRNEYLCIKLLALLKSDHGLERVDQVEQLRRGCFMALRRATDSDTSFRYEEYLILLSDIKSISMRFMQYLILLNNDYKIEMPSLLSDVLITQNMFGMIARGFHVNNLD